MAYLSICRVCMGFEKSLFLISNENIVEENENFNISQVLSECTKYNVSPKDELPQFICQECLESAQMAFRFKRKCEKSFRALARLVFTKDNRCDSSEVDMIYMNNEKYTQTDYDGSCDPLIQFPIETKTEIIERNDERHLILFVEKTTDVSEQEDVKVDVELLAKKIKTTYKKVEDINPSMKRKDRRSKNKLCVKRLPQAVSVNIENSKVKNRLRIDENGHNCETCGKNFRTKSYFQKHLAKKHINPTNSMCKVCLQSFTTKDELKDHIKAEGHDKPMLCPECGLRCKTSNILMVHMRRHKGDKPFKCKFCSKAFPRMDDLRVHEKYHTGEKSHFCEICGKGFQRKYNLTIHRRVHTGERPYKCPHCPQAFAQGNDLKSHIRRHTGERFRCEFCDAAFLQGYQIRQHKLSEHGIKEEPPTQRVAKFTSPEEQEKQIKENLQRQLMAEATCTKNEQMG